MLFPISLGVLPHSSPITFLRKRTAVFVTTLLLCGACVTFSARELCRSSSEIIVMVGRHLFSTLHAVLSIYFRVYSTLCLQQCYLASLEKVARYATQLYRHLLQRFHMAFSPPALIYRCGFLAKFGPLQQQVLYANFVGFFWNIYLSYQSNKAVLKDMEHPAGVDGTSSHK